MVVALQSKTAYTHGTSQCLSCIHTMRTIHAKAVVSVPHRYQLPFLSSGSPDLLVILLRSDGVELHSELPLVPVPPTSPFPARSCQTDPTVLDTRRSILECGLLSVEGSFTVDSYYAALVVSIIAFVISKGIVFLCRSAWSVLSIEMIYHCLHQTMGTSDWLSVMHRPPWLHMLAEVDLSHCCHRITNRTCPTSINSYVLPVWVRLMVRCCTLCCHNEMTCPVASVAACHTSSV